MASKRQPDNPSPGLKLRRTQTGEDRPGKNFHARGEKTGRSLAMTKMTNALRSTVALAALFALAGAVSLAQNGEAVYKSKCQSCHGAAGTPNPGLAKMLGIKPTSDPYMQKLTLDQVESAVKNGKGKMHPVTGLTDDQVKDVSAYFRTLK
jgi:predicted CXXCH cytochrome family protein